MKTIMRSLVVGKQGDGSPARAPSDQGHYDYKFELPNAERVLGGWWSLQDDSSNSGALKQFKIGGTSGKENDIPTIDGNSITFRVHKRDDLPGLIRILFTVLYV